MAPSGHRGKLRIRAQYQQIFARTGRCSLPPFVELARWAVLLKRKAPLLAPRRSSGGKSIRSRAVGIVHVVREACPDTSGQRPPAIKPLH
jgi:hypothetical protein